MTCLKPRPLSILALSLTLAAGLAAETPAPIFIEAAPSMGFDFVHFNGMSGEMYFPEMTGPGAAMFDYDNDGDLDLYLVQGAMMGPGKTLADALIPPRHPAPFSDRLYRNDIGEDGDPRLRFTDVTDSAGLPTDDYGMGVATGDYDNDGWVDLYVTNFGPNRLLRNNGDGTFDDRTETAGAQDTRWSVSASFFDYDRDGHLDLFIADYVDFSYAVHKICPRPTGQRDYCGPLAYDPEPDRLLRNQGDGTFEDVTLRAGMREGFGGALGVVTADFDRDGFMDIYVANDMTPNQQWMNNGDGTFRDDAILAGSGVNREGMSEASMGVTAADFDGDGDEDLFMAHLLGETNTLYINDGTGLFSDRTAELGLGSPSWNFTSFGTRWFDYDNDGLLDLLIVNGEVKALEEQLNRRDPYPLKQPNQLFHNTGSGYKEVTARAGEVFELSEVSRGAAFGDVDNDGDTDVLVVNNASPSRLLLNQVGQDRPWLGLRLVDAAGRDALGAWVRLDRIGAPPLWRRARSDSSFASASDPRVLFGLAGGTEIAAVVVEWPSGRAETFPAPPVGRYSELREGTGVETTGRDDSGRERAGAVEDS